MNDPVPYPPEDLFSGLPLLELFTQLRDAGLPIGIHEYHLCVRALQVGFGLPDRNALYRLCRALWVKSEEDLRLLDYYFIRLIDRPQWEDALAMTVPPAAMEDTPLAEAAEATEEDTQLQELHVDQTLIRQPELMQIPLQSRFILTGEYLPLSQRQMKQSWRYWRRPMRVGPLEELDVEATVLKMSSEGMLLSPVLVARRSNRAALLLLIDQGGSMVPFHTLSRQLAATASRGGRLGQVQVYFFHNCPVDHFYRTPAQQGAEPIEQVLAKTDPERTSALIFSDAGAARGGFNTRRIRLTELLLQRIGQSISSIAWLNPMPRTRWLGTTANDIAQLVPMFEMSRQGMDRAISVLRGRPTYSNGGSV